MFASPFVHHALAVIPLVCCLTIGVLLLVRSGNAGRGRGLILIAASLLGLYGVLGLTYRVLRILHPIVVPRFGEASAEKTQLQAFTDNVMQPAWAYSNSVLITLVILVLVPAMIRSRSPGRLDPPATRGHPESAPFSAPGAWPPVPPPPQARPWPPDPPGDPRRRAAPRPGSHRRSEPFPEVPPAQGTEPPRPRGRHRAPDPPDTPRPTTDPRTPSHRTGHPSPPGDVTSFGCMSYNHFHVRSRPLPVHGAHLHVRDEHR